MKIENQYPGINYGNGSTNVDRSNGIRYGVISQNSVNHYALDDIFIHGEDVAWKEAMAELEREHNSAQEALSEDDREDFDEDDASDKLSMNWESSLNNLVYEQDGYKLTGCLSSDLFVIKSPFFTYAQFCSPCVPGAGNLDNAFQPCNPSPDCPATANGENYRHDAETIRVYCKGKKFIENHSGKIATTAARLAKLQQKKPSPAEVLACVCREGVDADESFDNWCANFGSDTDSIKALNTYNECTANGKKARRILSAANFQKFAELSAQL